MGKIPVLKPAEVVFILLRLGFVEARQRGSHKQFRMLFSGSLALYCLLLPQIPTLPCLLDCSRRRLLPNVSPPGGRTSQTASVAATSVTPSISQITCVPTPRFDTPITARTLPSADMPFATGGSLAATSSTILYLHGSSSPGGSTTCSAVLNQVLILI